MPIIGELDARMTVNIQSEKKKKLQVIAVENRVSDSKLLLMIVDEWMARRNIDDRYYRESDGLTNNIS